jgi:hypothetical protein
MTERQIAKHLVRIARNLLAQNEIQTDFLAQKVLIERVLKKHFGRLSLKSERAFRDEDASLLFRTPDRSIIVKLLHTNKKRQKLFVWTSFLGRRDGYGVTATYTGPEKVGRVVDKLAQQVASKVEAYEGLGVDRKEMDKQSALDNEHFAQTIADKVASLPFMSNVGISDVGSDGKFWLSGDVQSKPFESKEKRNVTYEYENKPIMTARSASSQINKLVGRMDWIFRFKTVEEKKTAKVVAFDSYGMDVDRSDMRTLGIVRTRYDNTLRLTIQIS